MVKKRSLKSFSRYAHKWLALIVGFQLLIWLGTGLYFNRFEVSDPGGNHYRLPAPEVNFTQALLFPIKKLAVNTPPGQIQLISLNARPYYKVTYARGAHPYQVQSDQLFDALSGETTALNAHDAEQIALSRYSGKGQVSAVNKLTPPISGLANERNPVWQITLTDEVSTHIYLNGVSGELIKHVNNSSRLHQLMLKLHFMDYLGEGSFNNPFIIIFAILTLLLVASGGLWMIEKLRKGQI